MSKQDELLLFLYRFCENIVLRGDGNFVYFDLSKVSEEACTLEFDTRLLLLRFRSWSRANLSVCLGFSGNRAWNVEFDFALCREFWET